VLEDARGNRFIAHTRSIAALTTVVGQTISAMRQ
jgi:hypothetical protein